MDYTIPIIQTTNLLVMQMLATYLTPIMQNHKPFFMVGESAISWKSVKQTLPATSTYHANILAIHEASRECIWQRFLIDHIYFKCGLHILSNPTELYKDNKAVVSQIIKGFINGNKIKHIAPKFFFTHKQHGRRINVKKIHFKRTMLTYLLSH
jgi:hypothetical protein